MKRLTRPKMSTTHGTRPDKAFHPYLPSLSRREVNMKRLTRPGDDEDKKMLLKGKKRLLQLTTHSVKSLLHTEVIKGQRPRSDLPRTVVITSFGDRAGVSAHLLEITLEQIERPTVKE
jgi:hypothetical protein